jgi:O-antigen ligase
MHNANRAEVAGLVFNLRFFAMFMLAQVLIAKLNAKQLQEFSLRCIFWGGTVVVVFGALQVLVLPHDFLRHFGYAANIIPPYFTVDNNQNYVRILSTLRGPNALGAYLVFWLPFLLLVTKRMWPVAIKYRVIAAFIWLASFVTLFGTRSRSAWLGAFIALAVSVALVANKKQQKQLMYAGSASLVGVFVALALTWNSNFVQTSLWHRDPAEASSINSDNQRQSSLSASVKAIAERPFGRGPGSVNIASTYGPSPITVENYYLQVAEELGVIGLLIFVATVVLVALKLWQQRASDIAAALLAGLIGVSTVSMFLPAWGDETLSMLWWGMAGLVAFVALAKKPQKRATIR